ncbi:MAG: tRNA lysidine(34) synthetase TilS [Kiritimatiellales bacterium]
MNLIEKVKAAIERENLISEGKHIVVGVSGGADSVALLHILHRLGYSLTVAHLNHSIRGAEADGDEAFVKALCKKLGIKCVTAKADVPALAKAKGISLEMAAREARHDFFRSLNSSLKPQASGLLIALAHHADDQLETFFLRAARGTGPSGLGGMRSFQCLENVDATPSSRFSDTADATRASRLRSRTLTLLRPMLGIRRAEIIQWLEKEKIEWREDATNTDETISRNFIRHQLLPMFGKLNDRAAENLLRTMDILRDEDDFLSVTAELEMDELHAQPKAVQRRIIQRWLIEHGAKPDFDSIEKVIEFAAETDGSRSLDLEGLRIVNEYGELRAECGSGILPLARGWKPLPQKITIKIEEGVGILREPWCASVSLAKVAGREVTVRVAKPGDRMEPYGMEGSKKLQDIFTDLKIPKAQREQWPVVECGGEIIWLPGYRIARGWELSSDSKPALHLFANEGCA